VSAFPNGFHKNTLTQQAIAGGVAVLLDVSESPTVDTCLGVASVPPGRTSSASMIKHNVSEMMYVQQGIGRVECDGATIPFEPGDAIFIPPDACHSIVNHGAQTALSVYFFPQNQRPGSEVC
jgi:mannose-6-phosphate isomerase-like protein (cupin superfamily)